MHSLAAPWLLAVFVFASVAHADTLDQSYAGGVGTQAGVNPSTLFTRAQTFTVGLTGTLTRVRLQVAQGGTQPGAELTIDVRPTDETGAPLLDDGSALGSVVVDAQLLPGTQTGLWDFDFAAQAIPVVAGEQLAIVARSNVPFSGEGSISIGAEIGGGYEAGEAWLRNSSWSLQDGGGVDWLFETYVPEPAGAATAAAAIFALGLLTRRRA